MAAVSFECPSGPSEILRDGGDGLLVPPEDPKALAALMSEETRRKGMAERAPEICERFGEENYLDSLERLLTEVAAS